MFALLMGLLVQGCWFIIVFNVVQEIPADADEKTIQKFQQKAEAARKEAEKAKLIAREEETELSMRNAWRPQAEETLSHYVALVPEGESASDLARFLRTSSENLLKDVLGHPGKSAVSIFNDPRGAAEAQTAPHLRTAPFQADRCWRRKC